MMLRDYDGIVLAHHRWASPVLLVPFSHSSISMPVFSSLFTILVIMVATAISLQAQDDPFAGPMGIPGFDASAETRPAPRKEQESASPDTPLSLQWKSHARRGHLETADAIAALARIGRWSDVDQLVTEAAGRRLSEAALAEMGRRIDPAVMIRIRSNDQISDQSRQWLGQMSVAAKSAIQSPARIKSAIAQLDSPSRDEKLAALRTLRSGGDVSIAELAQAVTEPKTNLPRGELLRALASFQSGGQEALEQLALYSTDPQRRRYAVDALVRWRGSAAEIELLTALHAQDSSDEERSAAAEHLLALGLVSAAGSLPDQAATERILSGALRQQRIASSQAIDDYETRTFWSLNEQGNGVVFQTAPAILKPYRDAADAAARVRRLGALSPATRLDALCSDLGYRLMIDPDWGDQDQIEGMRAAYPEVASATTLAAAIDRALVQQDLPALTGLMRLVPAIVDPAQTNELLRGSTANPSPLVRAVDHAKPRIRFEAAVAIAALTSPQAYPGSSRVRRTLGEMLSLGDRPLALLLETRPHVIVQLEGLLHSQGYQVLVASTASDLEKLVDQGGDLRLIFAKTQIADRTPLETLDSIRRQSRGAALPVLFYGTFPPGLESPRWGATTLHDDPFPTLASLSELEQAAHLQQRLPPLSVLDRQHYRKLAQDGLDRMPALR